MAKSNIHTRLVGVFLLASTLLAGCEGRLTEAMSTETEAPSVVLAADKLVETRIERKVTEFEDGLKKSPDQYQKTVFEVPQSRRDQPYTIPELVSTYRELVPINRNRVNVHARRKVFIRWLAARHRSAEFQEMEATGAAEFAKRERFIRLTNRQAVQEYEAYLITKVAQKLSGDPVSFDDASVSIRLTNGIMVRHAERRERWESETKALRQSIVDANELATRFSAEQNAGVASTVDATATVSPTAPLTAQDRELANAWNDALEDKDPLPEHIMAFFDMLLQPKYEVF
ncbi:hypothetical protein [Cupriavidus sp. DL-D2]|uniref:hypothetical protein n=1 Tax=Cupriavidus sp. DL-D2 TaxID=3144974 RepID=UPI003215E9D3